MLNDRLSAIYRHIVSEAIRMVLSHVDKDDLKSGIDYASIYAQSPEEFNTISKELKNNGRIALERPSGDYYRLYEPLRVLDVTISHCRVRVFDNKYPERGYIDFEVKDFNQFKKKYLSRPNFSLLSSGEEMLELRDPKFTVRAYFPSGNLGSDK